MTDYRGRLLGVGLAVALAACGPDPATTPPKASSPTVPSGPGSTTTVRDIMELLSFAPLEPGTYFIDPDADESTPLRVVYTVPAEGWSQWIGAFKRAENGHVGVSITTVTNLVRHGCRDHSEADPPVGPGVDDLATALAHLPPFRVTSPPTDVTIYGYGGKHLELTVPPLPVEGSGADTSFTGCAAGDLKSWIAPILATRGGYAFYGYTPDHTEEFWILDVDGYRLVIEANWSLDSPPEDLAEMRAILRSIQIEP